VTYQRAPPTVDTPVMKGALAVRIEAQFVIVPILRAGLGNDPRGTRGTSSSPRLSGWTASQRGDARTRRLPRRIARRPGGRAVVLCDPMLATGGSLVCVLDMLRSRGAGEITVLCLIVAQSGLDHVASHHPDVQIVAAALDETLNDVGYIVPGWVTLVTGSLDLRFVSRQWPLEANVLVPEFGVLAKRTSPEVQCTRGLRAGLSRRRALRASRDPRGSSSPRRSRPRRC